MITEIWKPIVGYEGLYEVSNLGMVRSLDKYDRLGRFLAGRIMRQCDDGRGYKQIALHKNGKRKLMLVHRLVAKAFIPNPYNLPVVNHLDSNPSNNIFTNLEWTTQKENVHWNGAIEKRAKTQINRTDISKPINQYDLNGNYIKTWPSSSEVRRFFGFACSSICVCCHKKGASHNFQWRFYDDETSCENIKPFVKPNTKQVKQFTLNGSFIREWPSLNEIQRQTGWYCSNIHKAITGKIPSSYGFRWSY